MDENNIEESISEDEVKYIDKKKVRTITEEERKVVDKKSSLFATVLFFLVVIILGFVYKEISLRLFSIIKNEILLYKELGTVKIIIHAMKHVGIFVIGYLGINIIICFIDAFIFNPFFIYKIEYGGTLRAILQMIKGFISFVSIISAIAVVIWLIIKLIIYLWSINSVRSFVMSTLVVIAVVGGIIAFIIWAFTHDIVETDYYSGREERTPVATYIAWFIIIMYFLFKHWY